MTDSVTKNSFTEISYQQKWQINIVHALKLTMDLSTYNFLETIRHINFQIVQLSLK